MIRLANTESLFLLQLPENNDIITIKSRNQNDPAYLTTLTHTYQLKQVLSSNTLVIIDKSSTLDAVSQLSSYIECIRSHPKTDPLSNYLVPFSGPQNEPLVQSDPNVIFYSSQDFNSLVQASPAEIHTALDNINAFQLNGYWRSLDIHYKKWLLDNLIVTLTSSDVDLNNVSLDHALSLLNEPDSDDDDMDIVENNIPKPVVKSILASISSFNGQNYAISPFKVGRFIAIYLFETTKKVYSYTDFIQTWSKTVPQLLVDVEPSMLRGTLPHIY
jgi:hypothetical protein